MAFLNANRNDLLASLKIVSGIVDRKHTFEIFSNVLLEKKNGQLWMISTDKEIQVTANIKGVEVSDDDAITVNAKLLQDILSVVPQGANVELVLEENKLNVKSGKSRWTLQTLPADEFTRMKENVKANVQLSLPKQELKRILSHHYAMGISEPRQFLNGLLFKLEGERLVTVATDGHRMAFACAALKENFEEQQIVLPRKTVLELNRLIANHSNKEEAEEVQISISGTDDKRQVSFAFDGIELISKILDTEYPDYRPIIPTDLKFNAIFEREELSAALQRVAVVTAGVSTTRAIHFNLSQNKLKLTTFNQKNEEAQEEMDVIYVGEKEIELIYNIAYMDVLQNIGGKTVTLFFNDEKSTAVITTEGDENFKYALMPIRA